MDSGRPSPRGVVAAAVPRSRAPARRIRTAGDRAARPLAPFSMLLTADAEAEAVPLDPGPIDVLKVAHHGSDDAGLDALLDRTAPSLAVISVGADNPYGHPDRRTPCRPSPSTRADAPHGPGWRRDDRRHRRRLAVEAGDGSAEPTSAASGIRRGFELPSRASESDRKEQR